MAEIMLQRTRAEQVVPIYNIFVNRYPDYYSARNEKPDKIKELMSGLGLVWRARKVIELLEILSEKDGMIPTTKEELTNLPGVGEYIANAFLSLYCGIKAPITDANAVRLWSRLFCLGQSKEMHRQKWFAQLCMQLTPDEDFRMFNYGLLDLCRKICKAKPICEECPLAALCKYFLHR